MRSFALVAALMGSALAAPYTHIANTKRASIQNKPTKVSTGPSKVVVTKENTLNGTYHSDKALTVSASKAQANEIPLNLALVNNLADGVNMYMSGADSEGKVFFLNSNAELIYPSSGGSAEPVKVEEDIAIPMGEVGSTFEITCPITFDSGRIYFAEGELEFFMVATDGGDGLVQPSIHNEEDSARDLNWGWSELTHTEDGVVWSNISYVDFVGLILSMTLTDNDDSVQEVVGLGPDAVGAVCEDLVAQGEADGFPWGASCIEGSDGNPLRVLALQDAEGFDDYWTEYVDEVWEKYSNEPLTINTQNGNATTECRVVGDEMECDGDNRPYPKPVAFDIWGCNTGPFNALPESDNPTHLAVVPRLCAAFVRTTLTLDGGEIQPSLPDTEYYTMDPTHHYSRIVHEHEIDGKGYAFPYDDVNPDASEDAAGLITSANHKLLTFHIGGKADA